MKIRQRKFVGLVATIAFLVVYALTAFILLGVGWVPVAMVLIRWMSRPDTEA